MPRKKRPPKLITLDTETIGLSGQLKRIAIYDGKDVTFGYCFNDILPKIKEWGKDFKVHIYCHNLDFDARKIPEIFQRCYVDWYNTKIIGRKYVKITTADFTLHDSFKLLPMSLSRLSKEFNLTHGKVDLWEEVQKVYPFQFKSHVDFLNRCDKDNPLYLKYLGYDVISLYELIEKLCVVSTIPFDKLINCLTTASMSKYVFKHGFNGVKFYTKGCKKSDYEIATSFKKWNSEVGVTENPDINYLELEYKLRDSYVGGRTEVFTPRLYPDNDNIVAYHYDINSLYPDRCLNEEFPVSYPKFYDSDYMSEYVWNKWLRFKKGLGFLKCVVYVPNQFIPPLPTYTEKLCFLTGYISGTWTFVELEYAIKNCGCRIVKFEECIFFERTFKIYANYMQVFNEMKEKATEENNLALRYFSKLMMNTAYGWFGMRRDDKTQLDNIEKIDKYDNEDIIITNEELGYIETFADVKSESIQVQIASYVTAYARIKLLDMLRKQHKKGKVYYCDTDSIVCEKPIDKEFVDNKKLGYWKEENQLFQAVFIQPKVYSEIGTAETTYKFKGITKERQKTFDFDFYLNIHEKMKEGKGTILIETGVESLPSLHVAQKKNKDVNELNIRDKTLNLENKQKRIILYDENTTKPYYMNNIETFNTFTFRTTNYTNLLVRKRGFENE